MIILKLWQAGSRTMLMPAKTAPLPFASSRLASKDTRTPGPPPNEIIHYNKDVRAGAGEHNVPTTVPGSGSRAFMWPRYNEHVFKPDGSYRPGYVTHMRPLIKYSPDKMWYVAAAIRGLTVDEALKQLEFVKLKGAKIAHEVVMEAREMAVRDHSIEFGTNLWVAESFVQRAMIIRSYRRHARMRMGSIRHRYTDYFIRLEEGKPPKDYCEYLRKKSPKEMLEDFLIEHRGKRLHYD